MLAYVVRRLLLIVPTLFGIMVINFVIVQAAPGGPVEQMIRTDRGPAAPTSRRGSAAPARGEWRAVPTAARAAASGPASYRGARGLDPEFIKELERMYGFDKPPHERFVQMIGHYLRFDFGTSFFRDRPVDRAGAREAAGLDLARPLDHAAHLPDLDPARHPQGGARRHALRRLDQRRDHRRLRHPGLPVRHPADRAVRRRQLLRLVPAARPGLGQLGAAVLAGRASSTISGTWRCRSRAGDRRLRRPDHADQELVPRGDQQAVRDDRARQGPDRSGGCSTATCSATPC